MAAKSSNFYRLEKSLGNGCVDVYEFHSVVNGNMYIAHHEEYKGIHGHRYPDRNCAKETGNERYRQLKALGYRFTGIYEMDIFGYKTKL